MKKTAQNGCFGTGSCCRKCCYNEGIHQKKADAGMTIPIAEKVDLSKYIETRLMSGRPHIRGKRVPVSIIASNANQRGITISELADEFTLTEAEVLAAMLYYREHQAEIDAQTDEDNALFEAMAQQQDAKWRKK
jgi:uncharacterized protein (DUF433 family)